MKVAMETNQDQVYNNTVYQNIPVITIDGILYTTISGMASLSSLTTKAIRRYFKKSKFRTMKHEKHDRMTLIPLSEYWEFPFPSTRGRAFTYYQFNKETGEKIYKKIKVEELEY